VNLSQLDSLQERAIDPRIPPGQDAGAGWPRCGDQRVTGYDPSPAGGTGLDG